jgi:hypothetical protein
MRDAWWLLLFYGVAILGGAGFLYWHQRPRLNTATLTPSAPSPWPAWAALFGLLALLRDTILLWAFAYQYTYDSPSYLYDWAALTDLQKEAILKRSLPYPLLSALVGAAQTPLAMIALQMLLGALAVTVLVYVLGRQRPLLGFLVGLWLVCDLNWGMANRALLSEGLYTTFHLLALAWLLWHFQQRDQLHWGGLLLAGLFYGWTVTLRPSGIGFGLAIVLAYGLMTRRWRVGAWVAGGLALFILGSALVNLWRVEHFGISGNTGVFLGVPLFSYDLFSPQNGPASAELDDLLRQCLGDPDYAGVRANYTYVILYTYRQCFVATGPDYETYESELYSRAYREAIRRQPVRLMGHLVQESAGMLSFGAQNHITMLDHPQRPSLTCRETFNTYPFCDDLPTQFRYDPQALRGLSHALIFPYQPYLLALPQHPPDFWYDPALTSAYTIADPPLPSEMAGLVAFVMWGVWLIVLTNGTARWLVLGSLAFIGYGVVSVAFGHIFVARYSQPLTPFYGLLAASSAALLLDSWPRQWRLQLPLQRPYPLWGACGGVMLACLYFATASLDQNAYASPTQQAERYLAQLESPMVYNPTPYFPDPLAAKWARPEAFQDDELGPQAQDWLYQWSNDPQAVYLAQAGLDYLVFDQVWWNARTPAQQAMILDTIQYRLVRTWAAEDSPQQIWLYQILKPPLEPPSGR